MLYSTPGPEKVDQSGCLRLVITSLPALIDVRSGGFVAPGADPRSAVAALWPDIVSAALFIALVVVAVGVVWWDARRSGLSLRLYAAFRALWLFVKLWHGVRPRGRDPLPTSGPAIVISNHTSPADPLFLQCGTRRIISFLMAREYFGIRFLGPLFRLNNTIPVNRTGRDTAATKAALRAIHQGRVIGIFPEGGIHLDPATLGQAKPGAAMLALLTRAPVIPAFIERQRHTNDLWQGILQPAHARVIWGRPIDLGPYYACSHDREVVAEVSTRMMQAIEALRPGKALSVES